MLVFPLVLVLCCRWLKEVGSICRARELKLRDLKTADEGKHSPGTEIKASTRLFKMNIIIIPGIKVFIDVVNLRRVIG